MDWKITKYAKEVESLGLNGCWKSLGLNGVENPLRLNGVENGLDREAWEMIYNVFAKNEEEGRPDAYVCKLYGDAFMY